MSRADTIAAAASVTMGQSSRLDVGYVAAGLQPIRRAVPPTGAVLSMISSRFTSPTASATVTVSSGNGYGSPHILTAILGQDSGPANQPMIETRTVMGRPAVVSFSPLSFHVVVDLPVRDAFVQIDGFVKSRSELDALLDSVHVVDEATWQRMLARCPGEMTAQGTTPTTAVGSC